MTRISDAKRPAPPGIIEEDYVEDIDLGVIKTGKEAEVRLVERVGRGRSCLLAHKVYVPPEHRAFRNDAAYRAHRRLDAPKRRDGARMRRSRIRAQVAMDAKSTFGREVGHALWMDAEWHTLSALWEAGCAVPYPVAQAGDGFLMQYIGDEEQAAPRLAQARVGQEALPGLFEQCREAVLAFARAGIIHADLSAYNILVWGGAITVIDLPQAVPYLDNINATDFLHRDCVNVCAWFERKGLTVDAEELFVDALNVLFDLRMEDAFRARG